MIKKHNLFEKYKKITLLLLTFLFCFILLVLCEFILRNSMGLGNPVIYDSSPIYGYRPLPNKEYKRFKGVKIKFNNLSLRASHDWDSKKDNKVIFLGNSVTYGGSYIENSDLFSFLTTEILNKSSKERLNAGNAGVNAWGIENICGLVVETHFQPAKYYITVVPELDFYRGLTRMQGMPFYNKKPKFALQELWLYFCYKQNNKRYRNWRIYANKDESIFNVEKAVKKLKKMDTYLQENGYQHILFISPSKQQVAKEATIDSLLFNLLYSYELNPIYIQAKLVNSVNSKKEINELYHDNVHLSKEGHKLWAKIIADEFKKKLKS